MCNDEAGNVVIYSLNASIHVYVHEDLHEIYLYYDNCPSAPAQVPLPFYSILCSIVLYNSSLSNINTVGQWEGGSSGGSLIATPDCETAVLGSNSEIPPAYSGLLVLRWAAIWDGTCCRLSSERRQRRI
jgi:hypothetical protein